MNPGENWYFYCFYYDTIAQLTPEASRLVMMNLILEGSLQMSSISSSFVSFFITAICIFSYEIYAYNSFGYCFLARHFSVFSLKWVAENCWTQHHFLPFHISTDFNFFLFFFPMTWFFSHNALLLWIITFFFVCITISRWIFVIA